MNYLTKFVFLFFIIILGRVDTINAKTVMFSSFISGYWQICSMNAENGAFIVLTDSKYDKRKASCNKKCEIITYATNNGDIFQMNIDPKISKKLDLPTKRNSEPAWSFDGKKFVYTSYTNPKDFKSDIYLASFGKDRINSTKLIIPNGLKSFPCWQPESKSIYYSRFIELGQNGAKENICQYNLKNEKEKTIISDGYDNTHPTWSSDGKYLAYSSNKRGNFDIYLWCPENDTHTQITDDPAMDTCPAWSHDNKSLAFVSARTGKKQIWLVDVNYHKEKQLTFGKNPCKDPLWGKEKE